MDVSKENVFEFFLSLFTLYGTSNFVPEEFENDHKDSKARNEKRIRRLGRRCYDVACVLVIGYDVMNNNLYSKRILFFGWRILRRGKGKFARVERG